MNYKNRKAVICLVIDWNQYLNVNFAAVPRCHQQRSIKVMHYFMSHSLVKLSNMEPLDDLGGFYYFFIGCLI